VDEERMRQVTRWSQCFLTLLTDRKVMHSVKKIPATYLQWSSFWIKHRNKTKKDLVNPGSQGKTAVITEADIFRFPGIKCPPLVCLV